MGERRGVDISSGDSEEDDVIFVFFELGSFLFFDFILDL